MTETNSQKHSRLNYNPRRIIFLVSVIICYWQALIQRKSGLGLDCPAIILLLTCGGPPTVQLEFFSLRRFMDHVCPLHA